MIYKTKLATTLLVISLGLMNSAFAGPQQPEDDVMRMGPNFELFPVEVIETAIAGWKWQAELSQKQQELVSRTTLDWRESLQQATEQNETLRQQLAKIGLASPIDVRTIQMIDKQIVESQNELTGLTARLKQMKDSVSIEQKELQFERDSKREEAKLMMIHLNLVREQYSHTQKLKKTGSMSESEVQKLRANVAEIESHLRNAERQVALVESKLESDLSSEVNAIVEQRAAIGRRQDELTEKRDLIQTMEPIQKLERAQYAMDLSRRMIEIAQIKQFELQLENTRNLALVALAEERLAAHQGSLAEDAKDDEEK